MGRKRGNYRFLGTYSWYLPGYGQVLVLLLLLLVGAVLGNVVTLLMCRLMGYEDGMDYTMLLSYPVMFLPPMLYASARSRIASYSTEGYKLDSDNFGSLKMLPALLLAMLATVALAFVVDPISAVMPEMPEALEDMLTNVTEGIFWVNLVSVCIFAPLFEEWLCRGMVLRGLLGSGKVRPVWAIVISALVFALIHMNLWQAVPAFIIGCLFGYVYYRTGSLKATMLMHCTNNGLALIISRIPALKDYDTWMDFMPAPLYWISIAACALLLVLIVRCFNARVPLKSTKGNCDPVPSIFE